MESLFSMTIIISIIKMISSSRTEKKTCSRSTISSIISISTSIMTTKDIISNKITIARISTKVRTIGTSCTTTRRRRTTTIITTKTI
jgi:vacuolar-type H+-ATPase subunit D/Vma8